MTDETELPDGVYVRLPAKTYFAQKKRRGSTDFVVLAKRPADWFYTSIHNPFRPRRKPSEEMQFGSALHVLLLEGEEAYEEARTIKPDTYPDAKTGELKKWNGNANFCIQWEADHRDDEIKIDADDERRVRHMSALIQQHPDLGGPMSKGMSEVTVFWTDPSGVKMRARFDKLLPRFVIDLKTYGGQDDWAITTTQECMSMVGKRSMDIQRYLYFVARQKMAELIAAGAVFGGTPQEVEWLKRVAAIEDWKWCWIFYRRRDDDKGQAPVVKPIMRSHFDTSFETGRLKVAVGLQNYQTFVKRFGFDVPWAVIEPAEEPADHEFPERLSRIPAPVTFPETEEPE